LEWFDGGKSFFDDMGAGEPHSSSKGVGARLDIGNSGYIELLFLFEHFLQGEIADDSTNVIK
jgi:hypothetical protein